MADEPRLPPMNGRLRLGVTDEGLLETERFDVIDSSGHIIGRGFLEVRGAGPVIFQPETSNGPRP